MLLILQIHRYNFFYEWKHNHYRCLHAENHGPRSKNECCEPLSHFPAASTAISDGQHNLWSNGWSKSNFDCRNGFPYVDYIELYT